MPTTSVENDVSWMRLALAEAARGLGSVEPNPMVGAVVVGPDGLVSTGFHGRFGGPHAEVVALDLAGDRARGATLYVTLEPCRHHGKTPPCTEAVIRAGIGRVVAAMADPFPQVAGGGLAQLGEAGIEVVVGVEEEAARRLNAPYLKRLATGLPHVTAKWAMTLDGKMACGTGDSKWISGPRSRALVHELRGRVDAIVVGIGTALADDPELTARPPGPRTALRVVLDPAARLPVASRLVRTAREVPVLVSATGRAPADRLDALAGAGCEILRFPGDGQIPILGLLGELGKRGMTNVMVEGGGTVLGAFADAGQIDGVEVYIAPAIEGGAHGFQPVRGRGVPLMADALRLDRSETVLLDRDVLIRGARDGPWTRPTSPERSA